MIKFHDEKNIPRKIGLLHSFLFFSIPTVILWVATRFGIDWIEHTFQLPRPICWFVAGSIGFAVPLFVAAFIAVKIELGSFSKQRFFARMRLYPLTRSDWKWIVISVIVIGLLSGLIAQIAAIMISGFSSHPPFLKMEPLTPENRWFLLVWLPFFFFNIMGEELFWRGYIFPGQEQVFGDHTWWIHGGFWLYFHLSFGWTLMLMLLPIIFIQSYAVQKTQNTWVGVVIHGIVNGGGFLAISFGLVG